MAIEQWGYHTMSRDIRSYSHLRGLFLLSQHFEKSNSHIANILIFTPVWIVGYSQFSRVTECVMNYLYMQNLRKILKLINKVLFLKKWKNSFSYMCITCTCEKGILKYYLVYVHLHVRKIEYVQIKEYGAFMMNWFKAN